MSDEDKSTPGHEVDRVIHEYDGIEEYDNALPNWWLYTLYATVVFAAVYWAGYHIFKTSNLPNADYAEQVAAARAREAERLKTIGAVTPEALTTLSHDPSTVSKGKDIFVANCSACHKPDGSGLIGPNLTDDAWLHGDKPDEIYKTINDGVPDKQMPTWGPILGPERIQSVTAFVLSIKNTNVPGGKAPQGEILAN